MKNSVEAGRASGRRLARLVAGCLDRLGHEAQRLLRGLEVGRKAALVADVGVVALIVQRLLSVWNTSTPMRKPSANVGAPTGMIMNS